MEMQEYIRTLGQRARIASRALANLCADTKNAALITMADLLEAEPDTILVANERDMKAGREADLSAAMLDRLLLDDARIKAMADGLRAVAKLPDPVGAVLNQRARPSGIQITKVRVPIGVIAIIYESRPNVTADAAGLCLKSGNAVILRGGSEALSTNMSLARMLQRALARHKVPVDAVQMVETADRAAVDVLLCADDLVDVVIPRGGKELTRKITEISRVPVIKHYEGICHTYIAKDAKLDMAMAIAFNAKVQRPGVCNAMETLLVDAAVAAKALPPLCAKLRAAGVELRGCAEARAIEPTMKPATEEDWRTEYLDLILSVKVVHGIEDAITFINEHGSHHSDAIVTDNVREAAHFLQGVDSAAVYVNASTRFTDGGEFGMGAEMGISTDKLHARGPVGLEELTTYKYLIRGTGSVRT